MALRPRLSLGCALDLYRILQVLCRVCWLIFFDSHVTNLFRRGAPPMRCRREVLQRAVCSWLAQNVFALAFLVVKSCPGVGLRHETLEQVLDEDKRHLCLPRRENHRAK